MLENAAAILNEAKRNGVSFDGLELDVVYENKKIHDIDAKCLTFALEEDEAFPSLDAVIDSLDYHAFCKVCSSKITVINKSDGAANEAIYSFVFETSFLNAAFAFLTEEKFDEETAEMYYTVKDPRTKKSKALEPYYDLLLKTAPTSKIFETEKFKSFKAEVGRRVFLHHMVDRHFKGIDVPELSSLNASFKEWAEKEADELLKSGEVVLAALEVSMSRREGNPGVTGLFYQHFFMENFAITPVSSEKHEVALYCFPRIYLPWVIGDSRPSSLDKDDYIVMNPEDVPEDPAALFAIYKMHKDHNEEGASLEKALETLKALDK